eukprot:m.85862 g.85862  ORF g.85862 m.85862 type:complete len:54 (-) comp12200_c0_seq5:1706-1867(-)
MHMSMRLILVFPDNHLAIHGSGHDLRPTPTNTRHCSTAQNKEKKRVKKNKIKQ